ncbi:class I SAM-dependent methyltransferase [Micromonospora endolithica]|uniref:class I SAM-dependent methyltransferase n=1 Tax=Micromonospora endolithica TaxID=230091 RepID=UPI001EDD7862|nr:class I SAM-dependent methyltransferase [Micromonospora endolithica]
MTSPPADPLDVRGVRRAYDTVAEDYAAHLPDTRAEAPLDLAMLDAFAAVVTSGGDARVLDAGCGAGRMSRHLTERGCLVRGVDLSPGMVARARRDHPDLLFTVGSLTDLPFRDDQFTGVLLWYSTIHTPPAGQARVFAEAARVLRPGGYLLVGFQSGDGTRDVSAAYRRRFGLEIQLERHLYTADQVAARLAAAGLREMCRLVRRPRGSERDDQAFLLASARDATRPETA